MNININSPDFTITEALDDFIHKSASRSLEPVKDNLHQVHVHLRDINGPRGGRDKECTVEISMHGMSPILVKNGAATLIQPYVRALEEPLGPLFVTLSEPISKIDIRKHRQLNRNCRFGENYNAKPSE